MICITDEPIEVKLHVTTSNKGRGMISPTEIPPSSLVHVEEPYALVSTYFYSESWGTHFIAHPVFHPSFFEIQKILSTLHLILPLGLELVTVGPQYLETVFFTRKLSCIWFPNIKR